MNNDLDLKSRYDTHGGILMIRPNRCGYRVNISHPAIQTLYFRFKEWKGIPRHVPLSDAERFEFEDYIFKKFGIKQKAAENGSPAAAEEGKA